MPRLRERSFAFGRHDLPGKLARREPLGGDERIFVVFGLLAAVATVLAVLLALAVWQAQLSAVLADLLGDGGVDSALGLLVALVALAALARLAARPSGGAPNAGEAGQA